MTWSYLDHDDSRRADNEVQVTFSQSMNLKIYFYSKNPYFT